MTASLLVRLGGVLVVLGGGALVVVGLRRRGRRDGLPFEPGSLAIVRCTLHGIAYDAEREMCPCCAKVPAMRADRGAGAERGLGGVRGAAAGRSLCGGREW